MNLLKVTSIFTFLLGFVMSYISYTMLKDGSFYIPKLLKGGFVLSFMSIVIYIFPGIHVDNKDRNPFKDLLNRIPKTTKAIWVLALILSIILSNFLNKILLK